MSQLNVFLIVSAIFFHATMTTSHGIDVVLLGLGAAVVCLLMSAILTHQELKVAELRHKRDRLRAEIRQQ